MFYIRPTSIFYKNSYRESEPFQSIYLSNAYNDLRDGSLVYKTQSPSYYLSNGLTRSFRAARALASPSISKKNPAKSQTFRG